MLAASGRHAFSDPRWVFELKWHGVRCLLIRQGRQVRMLSREGDDLARWFPEIPVAAARSGHDFVIDAELVVLDHFGRPALHHLRRRAAATTVRAIVKWAIAAPATLMAFDLLALGERDLRPLTLLQRKAQLHDLMMPDRRIQYVDHVEETGRDMFAAVEQLALEGIVAKRADSRYQRGRSRDWVEIQTQIGLKPEARRAD